MCTSVELGVLFEIGYVSAHGKKRLKLLKRERKRLDGGRGDLPGPLVHGSTFSHPTATCHPQRTHDGARRGREPPLPPYADARVTACLTATTHRCRSPPPQVLVEDVGDDDDGEAVEFIKAAAFDGARPGYSFKSGPLGT
eukprot:1752377-Prymnesium_polylepis.1